MRIFLRRILFLIFPALLLVPPGTASAQAVPAYAKVVAACGTPPTTLTPGQTVPILIDTNGNVCGPGATGSPVIVKPAPATPTALAASTVVTGTTAVSATTGSINGCYIKNPLTAASQGIAVAENLFISVVTTATTTEGNTITAIEPGGTFTCVPGQTTVTSVNAATSSHKFEGVKW